MITRLHVKNFRTLVDVDWEPHKKLSILVGPNNSGKTNLCYALRFLSLTARGKTLGGAAADALGAPTEAVCRWGTEPRFHIEVTGEAHLDAGGRAFVYGITTVTAVPGGGGPVRVGMPEETLHVEGRLCFDRSRGQRAPLSPGHDSAVQEFVRSAQSTFAKRAMLGDPWLQEALDFGPVAANLGGVRYYRIESDNLRLEPEEADATLLADDGSNLAFVLTRLKEEDADAYDELIELLREVEPDIRDFEFQPLADGRIIAEARYSRIDEPVSLNALSDGTLRYLALCVVAVQVRAKCNAEVERPSSVIYEEPENGLYVRHLHPLVDRLKELSEHTQVIITTHSPMLLDFFEDRLDSIFVLRRPEGKGTEILRADAQRVERLLEQVSMGEMLYQEVLACD